MMVVQIGSVCQKLRNFTDQNGSKGGPHENKFWLFLNTKTIVTITLEKVDAKMTSFVLLSFLPKLWP